MVRIPEFFPLFYKTKNPLDRVFIISLVLILFLLVQSCTPRKKQSLLILHAGSLSIPFERLAKAFMTEHPLITVQRESAGSRICARKISELGTRADVMASADSEVIRSLLIPEYADYCIDFATNEIVLMFQENSRFSKHITSGNWYEVLLRPEVEYGHSDPNADPCGYRTLLSWKLAEKYYGLPDLFKKLIEKRPVKNIRSKEVDLLALLETGELDYIFIYRSVAEQHKGHYLILPDEINLKSSRLRDIYGSVSLELSGKKPGEKIIRSGAPMVYGITVPKTARHPQWGEKFVAFVLSPEGQQIIKESGQPVLNPPEVDNYNALPLELKELVKRKKDEV